jgi:hypothetical protein
MVLDGFEDMGKPAVRVAAKKNDGCSGLVGVVSENGKKSYVKGATVLNPQQSKTASAR